MCKLGLIDYMRQCGTVQLHDQNTLSDKRYEELKSAQRMIKSAIKGSDLRVDLYDGNSVPKGKFVYSKVPDCVFVEVTDLLKDKVYPEEFIDRAGKEPVLRQIFKFIDKVCLNEESPIEHMKKMTRIKYLNYLKKVGK